MLYISWLDLPTCTWSLTRVLRFLLFRQNSFCIEDPCMKLKRYTYKKNPIEQTSSTSSAKTLLKFNRQEMALLLAWSFTVSLSMYTSVLISLVLSQWIFMTKWIDLCIFFKQSTVCVLTEKIVSFKIHLCKQRKEYIYV